MKNVIYYFTGTGNTLAVSRDIAKELGDTELIPIQKLMGQPEVVPDCDSIGIAFPVYFFNLPGIVRKFVQKLRISGRPYIFGIATCGERPGGALFNLKSLLEEEDTTLAAGFALVMPENYIGPVDLMGDAGHRQEKYAAAKSRIQAIVASIRERKQSVPEGNNSAFLRFGGGITSTLMTSVYNTPRRFHATDRCNQCRTCELVCPTKNITVENSNGVPLGTPGKTDEKEFFIQKDTVHWGTGCTQCYACIHWCPREAIEIGGRTTGKPRYHHPDVTLADLLHQRDDETWKASGAVCGSLTKYPTG